MPRPTTKESLLAAATENFQKLFSFLDSIPPNLLEREYQLNERDRTVSDVLCHLHEWHRMVERWHRDGEEGKTPAVPGEGYTWKTLPALNRTIRDMYLGTKFVEAKRLLRESHDGMVRLIEGHTDGELFGKGVYAWTKSTTLGAYFVSATSSHYDWALKTLKVIRKTIDGK